MTLRINWNFFGYLIGWILFLGHFLAIVSHAVNIPYMDEWGGTSFAPGNQTEAFNPSFIFGFHNEHRIVFARLEVWLMHHLLGLNFIGLIAVHYLIYAALSWWVVRTLETQWQVPLSTAFIALASTVAHENHITALQGQFHFAIGFFFLAIASLFYSKRRWVSPILMISSIYALGFGVAFGVVYVFGCCILAFEKHEDRNKYLTFAGIVTIALALWFVGRPVSKLESTPTVFFTAPFWEFLFLLFIRGFGVDTLVSLWWGGIYFGLLILAILMASHKIRSKEKELRHKYYALLLPLLGILLSVILVSYGRVGLGLEGALASRYSEVPQFALPYTIVLIYLTLSLYSSIALSKIVTTLTSILILLPLLDNYNFPERYKESYKERKQIVQCVKRYLRGKNDGVCPIPVRAQIGLHIDYARELKLQFLKQ